MQKVSVVITCYNHEKYISDCLKSVFNQTYNNIEIIVIDDGSKDSSLHILEKLKYEYQFILISQENSGVCDALNAGIKKSTGNYIALLGSDDIMVKNRIENQIKIMNEKKDIDILAGGAFLIDLNGKLFGKRFAKPNGYIQFSKMIKRNRVIAPTVMLKKEVIRDCGLFEGKYLIEDYYYWLKALKKNKKIYNSKEVFVYYRKSLKYYKEKAKIYYEGKKIALEEYLPSHKIEVELNLNRLFYLIKLSLAGHKFSEIVKEKAYVESTRFQKIVIYQFLLLPRRVRMLVGKIAVRL